MHIDNTMRHLKLLSTLISVIAVLGACQVKHNNQDKPIASINKLKTQNKQALSKLIQSKYKYSDIASPENIDIQQRVISSDIVEVTLIHENLPDDSIRANKIIMQAKLIDNQWQPIHIQRMRKCYKGRGHTEWSGENCR